MIKTSGGNLSLLEYCSVHCQTEVKVLGLHFYSCIPASVKSNELTLKIDYSRDREIQTQGESASNV